MRIVSLLWSFVICSALGLSAQQVPNNPPAAPAAPITVIGCVVGLNGGYILTTDAGQTFRLEGQSLQQYSGEQVRAVGTASHSKKPGTNGKAENMVMRAGQLTLTLIKIDEVAPTCNPKH